MNPEREARLERALERMTPDERAEFNRLAEEITTEEETFQDWLLRRFPSLSLKPFAPHHFDYWGWIDSLRPSIPPSTSAVHCWSRGGGKSTTNELGVARVCDRLSRRYPLIISCKQDKADETVQNVATLLEEMGIGRRLGRYGHPRGWRRQQLQAANGFNFSGFGLDAGQRGVKIEHYRPDWILFDDIDELGDTLAAIEKKIEIITKSIIPAGSPDLAISFTQNAIHRESIMSRMIDGRADFLLDRNKVVPIPALIGFRVEEVTEESERKNFSALPEEDRPEVIQSEGRKLFVYFGKATWEGQNREVCRGQIAKMGLTAFRTECQHEVYTNVPNQRFDNAKLTKTLQEIRAGFHAPLFQSDLSRILASYPELRSVAEDGSLKLWERPEPGRNYVFGVDCSEGLNPEGIADYDCVQIINADEWTQAGVLHGRWESFEFSGLIDALGSLFGGAGSVLIVVLRAKGESTLSYLLNYHRWERRLGRDWGGIYYYDEQEILDRAERSGVSGMKPGLPENVATKPVMVTALADAIKEETLVLRDEGTVQEGCTYVKIPGGKTGGMSGCNDDRVASLYAAVLILSNRYERRVRQREKREEEEREDEWEETYSERGWKKSRRDERRKY